MNDATTKTIVLEGVSRTFYVKAEDNTSIVALDVKVQWGSMLPDSILDLLQDRLQNMYEEIEEAIYKSSGDEN